jgi:DNA mismatch repair ATPase MutS
MFFEDAEIASRALGIVLTKRGKHQGLDIPMCGVPIHAAQDYLRKLIGLGHRVAICEQVEDPAEARKRGAKSPVRRDVVRLVTRGTLTEDDLLPARPSNYLTALAMLGGDATDFALAWADVSTGETAVTEMSREQLGDEIARIDPAELLVAARTVAALEAHHVSLPRDAMQVVDDALFDSETAVARIDAGFTGAVDPASMSRAARAALGALLAYVAESQRRRRLRSGRRRPSGTLTLRSMPRRGVRSSCLSRSAAPSADRCATRSTVASRRPARACLLPASLRRSATHLPSTGGSMLSPGLSPTRCSHRACAPGSRRCPISLAP